MTRLSDKQQCFSFDTVADTYDEIRITPELVLRKFYETILAKENQVKHNLVVLDAGVGSGRTIEPVSSLAIQLVGIDISRKMLEKAVQKVRKKPLKDHVDLIRGDVANLPFRSHTFDMVISIHVLWLLRKWKRAVVDMKRVLKPKGYLITANHTSPEFENEIGRQYLRLELDTLGQRKLLKQVSIFEKTLIGRKVLTHRVTKILKSVVQNVARYYSDESHLTRQASSVERYAIVWKDTFSVTAIASLLAKRLLALQWSISAETFENLNLSLINWKTRKMKENPHLEITREFTFTMFQF